MLAFGAYFRFGRPVSAASTANFTTATVQQGTLVATVNAAGNIAAAQDVALNFQQSGAVQKVDVQVGDRVKAGQVLAELDTTDLNLQLQNAQVNLKVAQDKLAQAKNPNTPQDIASAQAQFDAAQAAYNKLVAGASTSDMAAAQAAVASAQAAYVAAVKSAGTTNSTLRSGCRCRREGAGGPATGAGRLRQGRGAPGRGELSQSVALQQATIDYQSAMANYQSLQATSQSDADSKVQQAKAPLEQAQANLVKLQTQVTQDDITAAQAQVTQAKDNLDKLMAGSDANTLDIAQNTVTQAEIAVKQAQLKLQQAQIVAPFDGVVTAVSVTPGQNAPSGTQGAIQMADLDQLQIVVNMAEVDINRVKVGQDVQMTLDALPNATLQGKVSQIAPAGIQQAGVVNYPVTIQLTNPPQGVKTGMTANVNVIVVQQDNVLMVPNRAIKTAAAGAVPAATSGASPNGTQNGGGNAVRNGGQNGGTNGGQGAGANGAARRPTRQQYVMVLKEGQEVQASVQTGVSNDTMTEIVSGLSEGDVVVLNATTTVQPRTGGGGIAGLRIPGLGR